MWTIGDVIDIMNEGVPFFDLGTMVVQADPSNGVSLSVSGSVRLPLEKAKHLSFCAGTDLTSNIFQMFHPELTGMNGLSQSNNYMIMGAGYGNNHWRIENGFVILQVMFSLHEPNIAQTARNIRDSNFYSVFEAALNDKD
jgi:hypothetical protein